MNFIYILLTSVISITQCSTLMDWGTSLFTPRKTFVINEPSSIDCCMELSVSEKIILELKAKLADSERNNLELSGKLGVLEKENEDLKIDKLQLYKGLDGSYSTINKFKRDLPTTRDCSGNANPGGLPECVTCLTDLNAKITQLEVQLVICQGQLTTCQEDFNASEGNLALRKGNLATYEGNLATCEGNLAIREGNLETCEGNLATLEGNLATCEANLITCERNLVTCEGNVGTCPGNLDMCNNGLEKCNDKLQQCNANLTNCIGPCAPGLPLVTIGDKKYYFSTTKTSWSKSRNFCTEYGMELTNINSEDERTALMNKLNGVLKKRGFMVKSYWIGLNLDDSLFSPNENGMNDWGLQRHINEDPSGSCVAITSNLHLFAFQLTTHKCSLHKHFICKLPEQCLQINTVNEKLKLF